MSADSWKRKGPRAEPRGFGRVGGKEDEEEEKEASLCSRPRAPPLARPGRAWKTRPSGSLTKH